MPRLTALLLAATLPLGFVGCNKSATPEANLPPVEEEHEAHVHPESFAEAMEQLNTYRTEIATAFQSGEPDAAHDALHEVAHLLEALPALASDATEDAAKQESVQQASEKLMDAYAKLDGTMHGGEEVTYESVQAEIDDAFATLDTVSNE